MEDQLQVVDVDLNPRDINDELIVDGTEAEFGIDEVNGDDAGAVWVELDGQ